MILTDSRLTNSNSAVSKPMTIAVAVGGGFIKGWDGATFSSIRSLVTEDVPQNQLVVSGQYIVKISDSPHAGSFAVGLGLDRTAVLSVADELKAEWYCRLALAAIAIAAPEGEDSIKVKVKCSAPNAQVAEKVKDLIGIHVVQVNNGTVIRIEVQSDLAILPEGLGTAYFVARQEPVAVIDFGYQNTTITGYDPYARKMTGHASLKVGVSALFERIAKMLNTTGEPPSPEEVRKGVEAGTFQLGGYSGGASFQAEYDKAFHLWAEARLHEIKTQAKAVYSEAPAKYLAGGGSLLPGMEGLLKHLSKEVKIERVAEPQRAEVRGMYRF